MDHRGLKGKNDVICFCSEIESTSISKGPECYKLVGRYVCMILCLGKELSAKDLKIVVHDNDVSA